MGEDTKRRIGVYVCHCGLNIAGIVDVEKLAEYAGTLDSVVVARHYPYMCSDPGQTLIRDDIENFRDLRRKESIEPRFTWLSPFIYCN